MDPTQLHRLVEIVSQPPSQQSPAVFRINAQKLFTMFAQTLGLHSGEFFIDWGTAGTPVDSIQLRTQHLLARAVPGRDYFIWWPTRTFFVPPVVKGLPGVATTLTVRGAGIGSEIRESWHSLKASQRLLDRVLRTVEQFIITPPG